MNDKTGVRQGQRRAARGPRRAARGPRRAARGAAALAGVAVVAVLATGCGVRLDLSPAASPAGGPVTHAQELALVTFAHCMRGHGVPGFPVPAANGQGTPAPGAGVNPGSPGFRAAVNACQRVLPAGVHLQISAHISVHAGS